MRRNFLCTAFIAALMAFCAEPVWAQRTSTLEEKLEYGWDPARGDDINGTKATTPQQCRDLCLTNNRCRYWNWTELGANGQTDPKLHANCVLLKATTGPTRGAEYGYRYAGGMVSDGTSSRPAGNQSAPTASSQPFPQPRPGLEIVFQVPPPNNPYADRYATMRFQSNNGDRTRIARRVWEGPLSNLPTVPEQTVDQVFDEVSGNFGDSSCSLNVSERELRRIAIGTSLTYTRTCESFFRFGGRSHSTATITRTVERNERVTVPAGTFDAVVVKKVTRTQYRSFDRDGDLAEVESAENELTRWWVPTLGFYVKEQSRSRVVDRTFSQKLIEEYQREGEPLRPRSTNWASGPAMAAIIIQ